MTGTAVAIIQRTGRPSGYSPYVAEQICRRIADGESLRSICRSPGMPDQTTVHNWFQAHPEFFKQYTQARRIMAAGFADEIVAISDDGTNDFMRNQHGNVVVDQEHIARSRLRVDTRKWLISKLLPREYGDKVEVNNTHAGPDGGPIRTEARIVSDDPVEASREYQRIMRGE